MTIYHKHHIIPRHMGGTDDPSNLIKVTVEQHALLHKKLWEDLGHQEDYIAWQCLSGQITMSEAKHLAVRMGQLNSASRNRGRVWTEEEKEKQKRPNQKISK